VMLHGNRPATRSDGQVSREEDESHATFLDIGTLLQRVLR